jgi:hypothetical protein
LCLHEFGSGTRRPNSGLKIKLPHATTMKKRLLLYGTAAILGVVWALYAQRMPAIPNFEIRQLIAQLLV